MTNFVLSNTEKCLYFLLIKISYFGIEGFAFAKINHSKTFSKLKSSVIFIHEGLLFLLSTWKNPFLCRRDYYKEINLQHQF